MLRARASENLGEAPVIETENPQARLAVPSPKSEEGKLLRVGRPGRISNFGAGFEGNLPEVLSIDVGQINLHVLEAFEEGQPLAVGGTDQVPEDLRIQQDGLDLFLIRIGERSDFGQISFSRRTGIRDRAC